MVVGLWTEGYRDLLDVRIRAPRICSHRDGDTRGRLDRRWILGAVDIAVGVATDLELKMVVVHRVWGVSGDKGQTHAMAKSSVAIGPPT